MADAQIVSCPGCSKRYSVPGGVPPGQFQCQDCSAVVVYGRSPQAAAAPARVEPVPSPKAKAAGAATKHGRRRGRGRHDRDEEDEEERGQRRGGSGSRSKDPTMYLLGIAGVVVAGIVIAVVASKGKAPPKPKEALRATAETGDGSEPLTSKSLEGGGVGVEDLARPGMSPVTSSTPLGGTPGGPGDQGGDAGTGPGTARRLGAQADEKPSGSFQRAANSPSGGNYGKTPEELRELFKTNRAAIVTDFDHLSDTPPDVRRQIDADVLTILNPDAGRESLDACDRLIKLGRPALPKLVGGFSKLDFSKHKAIVDAREVCIVADQLDSCLREISGWTKYTKLQFNPQGKLQVYTRVVERWYEWWLNRGFEEADYPKPKPKAEEE